MVLGSAEYADSPTVKNYPHSRESNVPVNDTDPFITIALGAIVVETRI